MTELEQPKIIFELLRFKNFGSYGGRWNEMILNTQEVTIISGKNGYGKSHIISALYFVLTGMTLKGTKKDRLINNINKKNCIVELEFRTNGKHYLVRRGLKPGVFNILEDGKPLMEDGKRVTFFQEKLELITGLTPNLIKNNLLINSKLVSFFELKKDPKRKLVDEIFNLFQFNKMLDKEKETMKRQSNQYSNALQELALATQKLEGQEAQLHQYHGIIKRMEEISEGERTRIENELKKHKLIGKRLKEEWTKARLILDDLMEKNDDIEEFDRFTKQNSKEIKRLQEKIENQTPIDEICFNCAEPYKPSKIKELKGDRERELKSLEESIGGLKMKQKLGITTFGTMFDEKYNYDGILEKILGQEEKFFMIDDADKKVREFDKGIHASDELIKKYSEELEDFSLEIPPKPDIDPDETRAEIKDLKLKIKKLSVSLEYLKAMNKILMDGDLKSFIIMKYLPFLNEQFNYYTEYFSLGTGFSFDLDLDLNSSARKFSGFEYADFSSGEQMRLNLALLYTFIALSKMVNFGSQVLLYNILFLDEYLDHGLDSDGMTEFLETITEKNSREKLSMFIISHRFHPEETDFQAIEIIRKDGFSRMVTKNE